MHNCLAVLPVHTTDDFVNDALFKWQWHNVTTRCEHVPTSILCAGCVIRLQQ